MNLLLIFLVGLCVGSFLNVLIDRIPKGKGVLKGRSYCDSCKKPLFWYDLIPVFSFIFLKGKCRFCKSPVSFYYPVVELVTGILFAGLFLFVGGANVNFIKTINIVLLTYYLFIFSSLIVVFFTDLKYGVIPDKIVYSAILVSLAYIILNTKYLILSYLLSAIGAFLFFLLLYLITRGRGMGFGDVKLSFLLGLILGFPNIIVAFYLAFLTGAIWGVILILWGKKRLKGGTIPFGPFLVLGTLIMIFWGDLIIQKITPLFGGLL